MKGLQKCILWKKSGWILKILELVSFNSIFYKLLDVSSHLAFTSWKKKIPPPVVFPGCWNLGDFLLVLLHFTKLMGIFMKIKISKKMKIHFLCIYRNVIIKSYGNTEDRRGKRSLFFLTDDLRSRDTERIHIQRLTLQMPATGTHQELGAVRSPMRV